MLFTYWVNPTLLEPPSAEAWRLQYPGFRIFCDDDVRPLLSPERLQLYDEISLPACKSDVARLVLLREYGGLYMDAHAGPTQPEGLAETIDALASFELVLFCRAYLKKTPDETHLMNGAIAGRRHSLLLDQLIDCAFDHLAKQKAAESATSDYVHYTLWGIAGTWILLKCFFDLSLKPNDLKTEFKDKILVRHLASAGEPGFEVYKFYGYREPGTHWSERQKHERLFVTPNRNIITKYVDNEYMDNEAALLGLVAANPRSIEFPLDLSRFYSRRSLWLQAEEWAVSALARDHNNPEALFHATIAQWRLNRISAAESADIVCRLVESTKALSSWFAEISACLQEAGDIERALIYAEKAVKQPPEP